MTKTIILGHENPDIDSIVSGYLLETLLTKQGKNVEFIIPDLTISKENIELCKIINLDPTKYQKPLPKEKTTYILVDHHERKVNGLIQAIYDHHPTNKNILCNYYHNVPSSSVSMLIVKNNEQYFSKADILMAIFAAMVDTVAFHSPKTISSDIDWCKKQCQKYHFDFKELSILSMCPTNMNNLHEAALNGLKKHNINNFKIASSYLHLLNPEQEKEKISAIIEILKNYRKENNYTMFAFLVHDITDFTSTLYKIYDNYIETVQYNKYASRGTIVIPELMKKFQK